MPQTVYEGSFSLPSLNHKATLLVGPDCSLIVSKNPYANAVEIQLREGVVQKQADCLASMSLSSCMGS